MTNSYILHTQTSKIYGGVVLYVHKRGTDISDTWKE